MVSAPWRGFDVTFPQFTLERLVKRHALQRPDVPAVIDLTGELSWAELDERADKIAGAFERSGLTPGSPIGWLGRNGIDFPAVLLAARRAGLLLVGLNWRLSADELSYILKEARPSLVIADDEFRHLLPSEQAVVSSKEGLLELAEKGAARPSYDPKPDDFVTLFFTSGTTGTPKGIAFTLESIEKVVFAPTTLDFSTDSRLLIVAPDFHSAGWIWTQYGLAGGMTQVQLPSASPGGMLEAVERWKISHAQWVPTMLDSALAEHNRRPYDLSSLKMIAYGASPIAETLLQSCMQTFGCDFTQVYGMTESVGPITHLPPSAHRRNGDISKSQATGLPNPGVEVRIVDMADRLCKPGELGEIVARMPHPPACYWSSQGPKGPVTDGEGWLRTGDIGRFDDDGFLYVTDRKKDMIITGGENVYPVEVENILAGLPGVAEVAVFGIPDEKWGEIVVAAVVWEEGNGQDANALIAMCRQHLAHYKCPVRIFPVDSLPRNATGKVLRRDLAGLFGE